ncbi:MAG: leucyl aminopeptidase [Mycobacterium kyogaense]|uniref:leucyl aminopeptidase family protein n=1 Tax=Mycobacterium kyogaense TaxID=2212479 RepID=UPI002FFCF2FF
MDTVSLTHHRPAELAALLADHHGATVVVGLPRGSRGVFAGPGATLLAEALGVNVVDLVMTDPDFDGAAASRSVLAVPGPSGPVRVVAVGLDGRLPTPHGLFDAALSARAGGTVLSLLPLEAEDALGAVAEGHALSAWRYHRDGSPAGARIHLVAATADDTILTRAATVARATGWVRQLVETPPNSLSPLTFAAAVADFAEAVASGSVVVERWDADVLRDRGFGATLAVGEASARPPLAVVLRIDGEGPAIGLAGKGITFDSGGVNLKRDGAELWWMKSDMAGAAAVAAAVIAAAALGRTAPVVAVLPVAENMPGGAALRPGDVVRHPGGQSTEVLDTDCEGRLVLADALSWLVGQDLSGLVDVGTLTDSGGVGPAYWGCWTNAAALAGELTDAGRRAFDPGWQLPLHPTYRSMLPSRVADIANASPDQPDSGQLAATYLSSFVGDTPWVHIDNGSAAWLERDAHPWPAGATGTPVRALVEYLHPST